MEKLLITSIGPNKAKVLKVLYEATGWGLKESKDFLDAIEKNGAKSIDSLDDYKLEMLAKGLESEGAVVSFISDEPPESSTNDTSQDGKGYYETIEKNMKTIEFKPIANANSVSHLGREDTMKVLAEVERIAKDSEAINSAIVRLEKEKDKYTSFADSYRNRVSAGANAIIWTVTIIAALVGLVGGFLCIVTGLSAFIIMNLTVKKADLKRHAEKNNAYADEYLHSRIDPINEELEGLYTKRQGLIEPVKWAKDIVGRDMFYSGCVSDLYNIVKSRRADNLKEALNKYDETQFRARVEETQASIKNASEVAALESAKQTELAKKIEHNTHQAATAAQAAAYHTRQIQKNTRR